MGTTHAGNAATLPPGKQKSALRGRPQLDVGAIVDELDQRVRADGDLLRAMADDLDARASTRAWELSSVTSMFDARLHALAKAGGRPSVLPSWDGQRRARGSLALSGVLYALSAALFALLVVTGLFESTEDLGEVGGLVVAVLMMMPSVAGGALAFSLPTLTFSEMRDRAVRAPLAERMRVVGGNGTWSIRSLEDRLDLDVTRQLDGSARLRAIWRGPLSDEPVTVKETVVQPGDPWAAVDLAAEWKVALGDITEQLTSRRLAMLGEWELMQAEAETAELLEMVSRT